MNVDRIMVKTLSRLGSRGSFGYGMLELPEKQPALCVLTADLTNTSGLDRFSQEFPEMFYNMGIAEQNMIGVATGLAKEGFVPFVTTFANFACMRSYEQMRLGMGYMNMNMKVVGLASGFEMGMFGNTHYGIEDISLMRSIPGDMMILSPADGLEVIKVIHAAAMIDNPVYIRLTGGSNLPSVYTEDYQYEIGKAIELRSGSDVMFMATGSMVAPTLKAAELLNDKGISAGVMNIHTIKPIDEDMINSVASHYDTIISVEEHSVVGGLGSAIGEVLLRMGHSARLHKIGTPATFFKAGDYHYLLEQCGLNEKGIAEQVRKFLS